jgi:hypothetical protein
MSGGRQRIDWSGARRLASDGALAVYAVPIVTNGKVGLCTLTRVTEHIGGGGCGTFDPARSQWGKVFMGKGETAYMLLVPDGVARVEIELRGGRSVSRPVQENAIVYQGRGVRRFTWRDASGAEHSTRASI